MSSYQQAGLKSALLVLLLGVAGLLNLGRFDWTIAIITVIIALHVAIANYQRAEFI